MGGLVNLWQPWSLRELVDDLAAGRTTPGDALARSRARIEASDAALSAWVTHHPRPEPELAHGPLGGVPLGVKDIVDVVGLPTRCGSALRADAPPAADDAAIVRAWRDAGAVPVGKTVSTEFAYFAPGPTRNPVAPDHTPGGSSSGSAAAVAAGHVPLALGTQTAGSVTRPAAFCGVASLVLTHGRVPVDGVVGLSPSLDSHGVYAAGVADLALAWRALTAEAGAATDGVPSGGSSEGRPPRVLVWSAAPGGAVGAATARALAAVRGRLVDAGATVVDFPAEDLIAEVTAAHSVVMAYEAARERAAELAVAERLSEQLAELLRTGAATAEAEYEAARRTIDAARTRLTELLASHDLVLGPAAPGAAPRGHASTGDPVLSRPWQALGLPVVTVPGLRDAAGLPLGVQLVGPAHGEAALLAHGAWIERQLG